LNEKIYYVREDAENYYFKLDTKEYYDDSLWVANKKTKKVSYMSCMDFVLNGLYDDTIEVNVSALKVS